MHLYIFDIDGTITEPAENRPHSCQGIADMLRVMDPYAVSRDRPRGAVVAMMQKLRIYGGRDTAIWLLTGRHEPSRALTEAWLLVNGVPYDRLFMVGDYECAPTHTKKPAVLLQALDCKPDSILVIDDDEQVHEHCKQLGIAFVNAKEL